MFQLDLMFVQVLSFQLQQHNDSLQMHALILVIVLVRTLSGFSLAYGMVVTGNLKHNKNEIIVLTKE